jgi:hypothetical protein
MGLSKRLDRARKSQLRNGSVPVSKTLLPPRPFSSTGRQKAARAHPEPMETEEGEKFADGRAAIAHRSPRDVAGWSMVASGRVVGATSARCPLGAFRSPLVRPTAIATPGVRRVSGGMAGRGQRSRGSRRGVGPEIGPPWTGERQPPLPRLCWGHSLADRGWRVSRPRPCRLNHPRVQSFNQGRTPTLVGAWWVQMTRLALRSTEQSLTSI